MASFMFDKYVRAVAGTDDTQEYASVVPLNKAANVAIALVGKRPNRDILVDDPETHQPKETCANLDICNDEDGVTRFKAIVDMDVNDFVYEPVDTEPESDDNDEEVPGYVNVKYPHVDFGENIKRTTIKNAIGAVLFIRRYSNEEENIADRDLPVCYLDFVNYTSSDHGPFKIVFNGGSLVDEAGVNEVPGTIFKMK